MANINSFADNVSKLVKNANNQLAILNGLQESVVTKNSTVTVQTENGEGEKSSTTFHSWNALSNKVDALTDSMNKLMSGEGKVETTDKYGKRTVRVTTFPKTPERITGLVNPTTFGIDANWWFEDLMYPAAQISIDLVGKIEDSADRILVNRVILDYKDDYAVEFYHQSGIENSKVSYEDLIQLLTTNGVVYSEDREVLNLPLSKVSHIGNFNVIGIEIANTEQWFIIDNLQYRVVENKSDNQFLNSVSKIKIGDKLINGNSLYEIIGLNEDASAIRLNCISGYSLPKKGEVLSVYNEPFQNKIVNVKFSNNEINIVYFKGVNEDYNIVANEWSEPIMFIANDLVFETDETTVFDSYYSSNIVDWGRQFIDELKESRITAMQGLVPNTPILNPLDFSVVQINTQVNASMDSSEILKLKADIETTKSRLNSLKSTIEAQQTEKQTITDTVEYNKISNEINRNTADYQQLQTSYRTSLDNIFSILKENHAVDITPKYHVRGFFNIPEPVSKNGREQQVIGFEIRYRYIKEDETGVDLKTFTFTDNSGIERSGVYSDWNIVKTGVLDKIYDSGSKRFVWKNGNVANGTEININQLDLPISKGEKLEFKIRSISEAGYPTCPLKSEWSNSVIVSFPSNLLTSSDIENLINDINDENVLHSVDNQLANQGLITHIDDANANVNSVNGTFFKHKAENISYEFKDPDTNEVRTISVQEALDSIFLFIKSFMDYTDGKNDVETEVVEEVKEDVITISLVSDEISEWDSKVASINEKNFDDESDIKESSEEFDDFEENEEIEAFEENLEKKYVIRIPSTLLGSTVIKSGKYIIDFKACNIESVSNRVVAEMFNSYDFDVCVMSKSNPKGVIDNEITYEIVKEMGGNNVNDYSARMILNIAD